MRDASQDGLANRIETYALSHFPWFWQLIMASPLRSWANGKIISRAASRAPMRPYRLSSMPERGDSAMPGLAGYTSWESLTDTNWFGRHLPPKDMPVQPPMEDIIELYRAPEGKQKLSEDSTVLFLSFAQWFTDGFLMTDSQDRRRTHTSHHIDFNPLYGLSRPETQALRTMSEEPGQRGRMKSEKGDDGGEYPPKLYGSDGQIKPEFAALRPPLRIDEYFARLPKRDQTKVKKTIYALGGERAGTTPFTVAMSTLFLREHNRLAAMLEAAYPDWGDERIFQTARNINIVLLIKIVVEDYINHISPYWFQLSADPTCCWHADWNKPNWIPIEFNMLYRWHSLTPATVQLGDQTVPTEHLLFNPAPLAQMGLGPLLMAATKGRATEIGLFNTAEFLLPVEWAAVKQGRDNHIGSYNDYREAMGYGRVYKFDQITGDKKRQEALKRLYGEPKHVELIVGLFAEDVAHRSAVPPLIGRMVALDAFNHALTNPLLSKQVFNSKTFTPQGMSVIRQTSRLADVLNRNTPEGGGPFPISMMTV